MGGDSLQMGVSYSWAMDLVLRHSGACLSGTHLELGPFYFQNTETLNKFLSVHKIIMPNGVCVTMGG